MFLRIVLAEDEEEFFHTVRKMKPEMAITDIDIFSFMNDFMGGKYENAKEM
ncbi:MAG: hypothetical protein N4A64_13395 [Marinisporobacter sp.]|jgi:hypothetical protein|nr:hypothetical protein [Marinisporobacter sp.]